MPVELHPHQEEAVEKMHNGCILYGDVGVGKTITSLAYYFIKVCDGEIGKWGSMQTPKDVYVITTAKVRDNKSFELQAAHYGVHTDPEKSTNGVKITVDSWNNLHKYVEVKDAFFIFDEQRVVGYGAWARAFIKIAKHNEWVLLSATPGDTWLDYIPVFIANGWYKHKTDFLDQHVVWTPRVKYPKVLRYQNVGLLVRRRNQVLVHMPFERHTKRHPVDIWCDYDQELFDKAVKQRWHVFENRPLRDVAELFTVMRKVVNSDSSRLMAVQSLLTKHPKLIVFYNFDYELEMLRSLSNESQEPSSEASTNPWEWLLSPEGQRLNGFTKPSAKEKTASSARRSKSEKSKLGESTQSPKSSSPGPKKIAANSPTNSGEQPSLDGSIPTAELCGFEFRGTVCKDRLPCARHEGLSPGGIFEASRDDESDSKSLTEAEWGDVQIAEWGDVQIAEWNGHKHQEIPQSDRWLYLVQYRAGAEGWNCIETDAVCFYSQTYSYRDWWQAHGRIDRINTPFTDLWYYHLISKSVIDKAIRKALKAKKSFNERDLNLGGN